VTLVATVTYRGLHTEQRGNDDYRRTGDGSFRLPGLPANYG